MSREIEFRGKELESNSMVYGDLVTMQVDGICIADGIGMLYRISPETVGEYTGLKDKKRNNAKVYEGDIYKWCGLIFPISVDDYHGYTFMFGPDRLCKAFIESGEYIGNIHENPELLK